MLSNLKSKHNMRSDIGKKPDKLTYESIPSKNSTIIKKLTNTIELNVYFLH